MTVRVLRWRLLESFCVKGLTAETVERENAVAMLPPAVWRRKRLHMRSTQLLKSIFIRHFVI